jgi:hypothetical protein
MSPSVRTRRVRLIGASAFALLLLSSPVAAQSAAEPHDHSQHGPAQPSPPQQSPAQHNHSQHGASPEGQSAPPTSAPAPSGGAAHHHHTDHKADHRTEKKSKPSSKHGAHPTSHGAPSRTAHRGHGAPKPAAALHGGHGGTDHDGHGDHGMKGFLGPYPMMREGSGTSWLPDTTPHEGIMGKVGEWSTMWHAYLNLIYDNQGGPRGGEKTFVNGMVMGMAQRQFGDGTFGVRAMLAPDPFMGPSGYPLLLASGETADGKTHLIDRQHPHDLFMELAAIYSHKLSPNSSVFFYAGLPGEPALGPPTFMHRTSGVDNPEAPITHHWLDSTHITFGVLTAGLVLDNWKIEASAFRGREPDQYRFDIEAPKLDSASARLTWNPIRELSMQVSVGRIRSPESLNPDVNETRVTASATYTQPFGQDNLWSSTFAWGRKILSPGATLDGYLLETAVIFKKTYTLFARAERVAETELHEDVPGLDGRILTVNKLTVGGIYDFYRTEHVKFGIGGLVSTYALPSELTPVYGSNPTSGMVFARMKVM